MHLTQDHVVITLPRLSGYKTLFINGALLLFAMLSIAFPSFVPPDVATVSVFFDTATGFAVAAVAIVNVALRLMTSTPAAPFKRSDDAELPPSSLGASAVLGAYLDAARHGQGVVRVQHVPVHDFIAPSDALSVKRALERDAAALQDAYLAQNAAPTAEQQRDLYERMKPIGLTVEREPSTQEPEIRIEGDKMPGKTLATFLAALVLPSMLLFSGLAVASLGGCATANQVNAVVSAESTEQRAFALYGSFTVLEERAAEMITDKRIPKSVRLAIQRADKVAKPLADQVRGLAVELNAARLAFNTAQGSAEKVAAASTALASALVRFQPAFAAMASAVNGARA